MGEFREIVERHTHGDQRVVSEQMFPIQQERELGHPQTFIPWWLAQIAYQNYNCKDQQSLERIAERGGFGRDELITLIQGKYPYHKYHQP